MENDPALKAAIELETFNALIASKVFNLRNDHKVSIVELAKLTGVSEDTIKKMEDADCDWQNLFDLLQILMGGKLGIEHLG